MERCQTCPVTIANELDVAAGVPPRFDYYERIERIECSGPSVFAHPEGLMARCRGHAHLSPCMPYAEWAEVVLDVTETT